MAKSETPPELILRELMGDRADPVVEAALAARKAVMSAAGPCFELIYDTYCVSDAFSFTEKLGQSFIHIATYAGHVNIGFSRGTELDDPEGILQGTGKRIRHIRLGSASDLKKASIKKLIKAAVAQGHEMADKKRGVQPPRVIVTRSSK